uniref:Uncharacterized protein n=1 Tax=Takifugu rubripes TaxID=31033 RepID=A0A674NC61_TAKRU
MPCVCLNCVKLSHIQWTTILRVESSLVVGGRIDICGPVHSLWTPSLSFLNIHNRRRSGESQRGGDTAFVHLWGMGKVRHVAPLKTWI